MFTDVFTPQANMKKIGKRETILSLLKNLSDDCVHPDEFTLSDYISIAQEEGKTIGRKRASEALSRLVLDGELSKRQACVDARIVNIYRKK